MHAYNAWLPPPVRELLEADPEKDKFHRVVLEIQLYWKLGTAEARFSSLKWISVVNTFLKARSELATSDVELLVKTGLDILLWSPDNLFIQIRWGQCIAKVLKKYRNHLQVDIEWRPLYKLLYETHFKRRNSYEGLALKQYHLENVSTLIRSSRRFFPAGSVAEIWNEFSLNLDNLSFQPEQVTDFRVRTINREKCGICEGSCPGHCISSYVRPGLDALYHNSGLETIGFLSLLLPTKLDKLSDTDRKFLSSKWFEECLHLWAALPNSHYWDRQWGSLLSRYTKHCLSSCSIDLDPYLPALFTHYLRSFEVPVGKSGTSSPIRVDVSREVVLAFNGGGGWPVSVSKYFAKAIVYMLKPGGKAESHLYNLIDLIEQYYHPSNGGSWTNALERFLHYLVMYFQKRLAYEQRRRFSAGAMADENIFLGSAERISFVKALLPLIERGQHSKDAYLAGTAANTASMLSFVEPSLVLPFINARFHTALNTITATHQLESAVTTLALAARPAFLACAKEGVFKRDEHLDSGSSIYLEEFTETLVVAMFNTLLGMDANDPPKTLATMELFSSILCNVGIVGDLADGGSLALPVDWSQWLDEFLSRLFVLLVHLEPSGQQIDTTLDDGYDLSSSTFLMQAGSFYNSVIELLFGRLTKPLYQQALKKLAEFVHNNALPGAAPEIGLLCSFAVLRDPNEATSQLLKPLMNSLVSSLGDFPSTGFGGTQEKSSTSKVNLSQAVETSVIFQLNILSAAVMFGGAEILPLKDLLNSVITAAFNAPSSKVTEAGNRVLSSLLGSLVFYYPIDQYKVNPEQEEGVEAWISTKLSPNAGDAPSWHVPNAEEIGYANELLNAHLRAPLASLRSICQDNKQAESAGNKDFLRVLFLRLDAALRGVGSCLPDFHMAADPRLIDGNTKRPMTVVGAFGARVGDVTLREETAETLHEACEYIFKERADDTVLLMMLIRVMDLVGNCASLEYNFWANGRHLRQAEAKCLTEPKMNFITNPDARSKRRPRWLVVDMVFLHNAWRSSQQSYRPVYLGDGSTPVPQHITLLTMDLLKLSLHRYDVVRRFSVSALGKSLKRFPALVKDCLPVLNGSLENPEAIEDSALGACKVLMLRPVLRHLTQDLGALASFFRSLLKSAHHESVKAQAAINELFVVFSVRFGGLPAFSNSKTNPDCALYAELVSHIKGLLSDGGVSIHWRYNLMANGMLLLLLVPPFGEDSSKINIVLESRQSIAGQFLSNLKSELPALRPLSIIALLCLLRASLNKVPVSTKSPESLKAKGEEAALSLETTLIPVFEQGFVGTVIQNLAFDHHYPEGQGRMGRFSGVRTARISDLGLTALMPPFTRDWPRTRTWDAGSTGEAFASNNAKIFKRLVQECGGVVLEALQGPLEEAVKSAERGQQCVAAEIMAGLLHSDVECVAEAWGPWLRPLLRKALIEATVEAAPEWAACIRFACTGKGSRGEDVPLLRFEILDCLLEPVSSTASTSLVAKRLMLLRAALVEFAPAASPSKEDLLLATFLQEVTSNMTHPAPQVRENVGSLLCIVLGILQGPSPLSKEVSSQITDRVEVETSGLGQTSIQTANEIDSLGATRSEVSNSKGGKWGTALAETATVDQFQRTLIEEAKVSAIRIQSLGGPAFGGSSSAASTRSEDLSISDNRDAKWMETVFYFIIASIKSGKAVDMSDTLIGLLHPLLSLQETQVKELSILAKTALRLVHWHPIPVSYLPSAVRAVLDAASDSNWHTRVAALTFVQSFVYRHIFILTRRDVESLWAQVQELLSDPQVEVRELAATTLAGLMKDSDSSLASAFREQAMQGAGFLHNAGKTKKRAKTATQQPASSAIVHGRVLGLAACVLSVPYEMPSWLPDMVTLLGRFIGEPTPIRSTVKKTIAEFRRTHSDTWAYQKSSFSEEQLEVLSDLATSASYFA